MVAQVGFIGLFCCKTNPGHLFRLDQHVQHNASLNSGKHSGRGGPAIRIVVCRIVDLDCGDPDCDKLRRSGLPDLTDPSRYDDPDCHILIDQLIM